MKKSRFGLPLLAVSALALSGCASGGGGGGGVGGDEGNPPRDNEQTRSAELFLTQAQSLGNVERYNQALEAALGAIMEEPTNPLGYYQAGRAQIGLGDYLAADSLFNKATELYPGYGEDVKIEREAAWIELFNQALDPLDSGDTEEGVRSLESAEVIFRAQRPEALINLGVSYNNLGRVEDAIEAYGSALEIIRGPRMAEADSAKAAAWSERELSVAFNRAQLLSSAERYDEAAAEYETYLDSNPGEVSALSSLAIVLTQAGMADSAQAIYDNLLTGTGLGAREYMNIGVGLYTADAYDKAAEAFGAVAEMAPENRDAVFNLAQSLFEAGSSEALLPVARQLLELDGYNPDSYTILGQALVRSGDDQEAVRILQAREDLPFRLETSQIQPRAAGGASVVGQLVNNTLEAGTTVTIRVHFNGEDGAEVGSTDIRVPAPAQGAAEPFRADLTSNESVIGYYFEVISPM